MHPFSLWPDLRQLATAEERDIPLEEGEMPSATWLWAAFSTFLSWPTASPVVAATYSSPFARQTARSLELRDELLHLARLDLGPRDPPRREVDHLVIVQRADAKEPFDAVTADAKSLGDLLAGEVFLVGS